MVKGKISITTSWRPLLAVLGIGIRLARCEGLLAVATHLSQCPLWSRSDYQKLCVWKWVVLVACDG